MLRRFEASTLMTLYGHKIGLPQFALKVGESRMHII